jgi:hypothetical protein
MESRRVVRASVRCVVDETGTRHAVRCKTAHRLAPGSLSYFRGSDARSVAWMAAFGQNREIHGNLEAYLFEASLRPTANDGFYARLESVAKDILDVGFHPVNTFHVHRQSQVGALTGGYIRDLVRTPRRGVWRRRRRDRLLGAEESGGLVRLTGIVSRFRALSRVNSWTRGAYSLIAQYARPSASTSTAAINAIAPPRSSAPFTAGRFR